MAGSRIGSRRCRFNAYWTALTFLDALAAVLLLLRPRTGLALTSLIIASDVAVNLFARFYLDLHLRPVALTLQLLFLVVVAGATLYARREEPLKPSNQPMKSTPKTFASRACPIAR